MVRVLFSLLSSPVSAGEQHGCRRASDAGRCTLVRQPFGLAIMHVDPCGSMLFSLCGGILTLIATKGAGNVKLRVVSLGKALLWRFLALGGHMYIQIQ